MAGKQIAFKRPGRCAIVALAAAACAAGAAVPSVAAAAFPGKNGKIVFNRGGDIWTINARGRDLTRLTKNRHYEETPYFSPSSRRIVFMRAIGRNLDIFKMKANGNRVRRLTSHRAGDYDPAFSPNGRRIVFGSNRSGDSELYVMKADGTKVRRLTAHPGSDGSPEFSPNGKLIVFDHQADPQAYIKLFTIGAGGKNLSRVTTSGNNIQETHPSFSPKGDRILFEHFDLNSDEDGLYTVQPDGSNLRGITSRLFDAQAAFSPNGRRIAFLQEFCPGIECKSTISVIDSRGGDRRKLVRADSGTTLNWGRR
jgi:Tol biopolymer transport system component